MIFRYEKFFPVQNLNSSHVFFFSPLSDGLAEESLY